MAALPAIALAISAVGTGVSLYGQMQQAKTQELFSRLNAQAQLAQATMSSRLATAQASLQAQQDRNKQVAQQAQAAAFRDEAAQRTKASQINIARQMEDQARFRSALRARGGKSGTVGQIDLLVNAAELQALENAESQYQTEIQRRQLFRAAEGAQLGAAYADIQAGLTRMEGEALSSAYRTQGIQAQMQGLANVSAARGASLGALGNAFAGFGALGLRGYELQRLGAFRSQQSV